MSTPTPDEQQLLDDVAHILSAETTTPRHVTIDVNDPDLLEAVMRACTLIIHCDGTYSEISDHGWTRIWGVIKDRPVNRLILARIAGAMLDNGVPVGEP